jgi:CheY-like chemotaxis protein
MKNYNGTIMVIEDNRDDQDLIKFAFKKLGIEAPIHFLDNGSAAIAYMMGEGKYADRTSYTYPTFIMTDLKMPLADGFSVLEFLKANPEWAVIPTVVFSASQDMDDIKKSYMLGASSYHVKPSELDELVNQIKVLHEYWMTCEVPIVDSTGKQVQTESAGKLGERFPQPSTPTEENPERVNESNVNQANASAMSVVSLSK